MRYIMAFLFCVGLLCIFSAITISCSDDTDVPAGDRGVDLVVVDMEVEPVDDAGAPDLPYPIDDASPAGDAEELPAEDAGPMTE